MMCGKIESMEGSCVRISPGVDSAYALKQGYTPDNCKSSHFQRVPISLPIHTMPIFRDCDVTCKHSILSHCHFLIVVRPFPSAVGLAAKLTS